MRKLGLIGGMSWVSTAMYYEQINKGIARRLGGLSSAPLLIESLDFAEIERLQSEQDWPKLTRILAASAKKLEKSGAEAVVLCSNTMHKLVDAIQPKIGIPVIHIGDVTAARLVQDGVRRAGLIGTRFTMSESFYRDRLEAYGISVAVPDQAMMVEIDRIIYEELGRGVISRVSQRTLKTVLTVMGQARNQAVILGCTELVLLTDPTANVVPIYDTTALHSQAAVDWILAEPEHVENEQPRVAAGG